MFRNYILVAFRNLYKNTVFTLINVLGLGLAISICTVAFFNHMYNYEFNRNNKNFNEIYRINSFRDMEGREQEFGNVPATLALQIKNDIPGVERVARLARSGSPVKVGHEIFSSQIAYVDPEFIDIFTFPLIYGDKSVIQGQSNVLISRKMANRLFGNEYPVGKSLSVVNDQNKEFTYIVAAVFEDLPLNCSFRIDVLTNFDNFLTMWDRIDTDWKFNTSALFVQLHDKSLVPHITQLLRNYVDVQNKARQDFRINRWILLPLKDVGANSRTTWNAALYPSMHPAAIISPPIMALFILLIACFNFANTSVAIFSRRLKEIGVRKTFGAHRTQLVRQFMFETFIICLLAMLSGIALAQWFVPAYSSLWSYMSLKLTFTQYPVFWIYLLAMLGITGFMSGVYPALFVSRFSPVSVIKGSGGFKGPGKFSVVLLTLQFIISVMAVTLGIAFERNARFQEDLDRGYDLDNIIAMNLPPENYASYRNEILQNPLVISAEGTLQHIEWQTTRLSVKDDTRQMEADFMDVGPGYLTTMGLRVKDGRLFDESRVMADRSEGSVVVNKMFVNNLGWDNPIGKTFTLHDTIRYNVIGVVEDFYSNGLWAKIQPMVLRLANTEKFYNIAVRGKTEDLPAILDFMKSKWKEQGTNYAFGGILQEDVLQEEKDINGSILKINVFLAIAATFLSLIGMYNMVSLDVIKRTREIGIRKIQGAPLHTIMYLMSRKFILVIAIASIIGCTGGYFLANLLMDSIWDYFVDINAGMLILSAGILVIGTFLTISFKIVAAAMKNPVISLRYE